MTKIHTLIVGTSKSLDVDAYYVKPKKKFWSLIYQSGLTSRLFKPEEYREFSENTGIGFAELVYNEIIPKDKILKENLQTVTAGIQRFISMLNSDKAPKRIVFNGKTASGWFFQFVNTGKIDERPGRYFNSTFKNFKYGKLPNNYNGIEIFVMPNTSGRATIWDADPWINLWMQLKEFKNDKNKNDIEMKIRKVEKYTVIRATDTYEVSIEEFKSYTPFPFKGETEEEFFEYFKEFADNFNEYFDSKHYEQLSEDTQDVIGSLMDDVYFSNDIEDSRDNEENSWFEMI